MHTAKGGGSSGGWRRWTAVGGLLLVVLWSGCTIKKPQVPSTDFTLSIPVADDMTTIREVAEDRSDFLRIGADELMTLDFSADFQRREEVGDRLRVRPAANSFETPIGDLVIPGQALSTVSLTMSDLLGQEVPEGEVPLIPGADIDTRVAVPLDGVESLAIEEGRLEIAMANGLPASLVGMTLSLIDQGRGGALIEALDMGDIEGNGGAALGIFILDGKEISGDLAIGISGASAETADVTVVGNPTLEIDATLSDLIASEATAVIAPQDFSDRQILEFPDDRIQVTRAVISRGGLRLRVQNDTPLRMDMLLSLDELKKPDGQINAFAVNGLDPGEEREVDFDLADNEFAPDDPLKMRLSYEATTAASDGPVALSSTDQVIVEAITEDLIFSRVEGVLNRVELPVEPVTEEVEFPEGLDNVSLGSTGLIVHLTSAIGFRSRIDLEIEGTNNAGESATLHISEVFERGSPDEPVPLEIAPNSAELTDFLNLLPSTVNVRPTVLLGDGVGTEVIEPSHWVQIDSVQFLAPARFQIDAATQIRPDPVFRNLQDDEARKRIETNLISAGVITNIENHLPLGVRVSLRVASWRSIVRDVIVRQMPELQTDRALLNWLLQKDVWNLIDRQDRREIRERIEKMIDLARGTLEGKDDAAIIDAIDAAGSADGRALFLALLLSSLDNDTKDGKEDDVEFILGRQITEEEWNELIAANVYDRPDLWIPVEGGPFDVEAAPVDAEGRVSESRNSRREIALENDDVIIFLRKGGVYTGVLIELEGTAGEVALFGSDYVNVRAATEIVMELNEDLVESGGN